MSNTYSAAQLREYLDGTYTQAQDDVRSHAHAGLTYGDGSDILSFIAGEWKHQLMTKEQQEVLPSDVTETKFYQQITKKQSSELLGEALQYGNQNIVDNVVGLPNSKRTDFSGVQTFKRIKRLMINEGVWIGIIIARMGRGKTDFAGLLSEIWNDAYEGSVRETGSNIQTFSDNDIYFNKYEEMIEWIRTGHDDEKRRLLILDEASQYLDYKTNPIEAQAIGKMLRLARKAGVSVIFIGHGKYDISPDIRNVSTSIIDKESKKKATFYNQIRSGDFIGKQMELTKIPATSVSYDTTEVSRFHFPDKERLKEIVEARSVGDIDLGNDEENKVQESRDEMVYDIYHSDETTTFREIADMIDVSPQTVKNMIDRHESKKA